MKRSLTGPFRLHCVMSYLSIICSSSLAPHTARGDVDASADGSAGCAAPADALDLILTASDIRISLREMPNGLTIDFTSDNPYRREQIKDAVLDFLRQRALAARNWGNNGYDMTQ